MLSSLLPPSVREAAYRRKFLENREENLFMGSFDSFAGGRWKSCARMAAMVLKVGVVDVGMGGFLGGTGNRSARRAVVSSCPFVASPG